MTRLCRFQLPTLLPLAVMLLVSLQQQYSDSNSLTMQLAVLLPAGALTTNLDPQNTGQCNNLDIAKEKLAIAREKQKTQQQQESNP